MFERCFRDRRPGHPIIAYRIELLHSPRYARLCGRVNTAPRNRLALPTSRRAALTYRNAPPALRRTPPALRRTSPDLGRTLPDLPSAAPDLRDLLPFRAHQVLR